MGRIQVMSEALANQIAAGEVVERPASCVKELVENSLDAQARHIGVTLEDGGIARIQVQDDGIGMDADDLLLATARHATSKIRQPRDLTRIQTLGFRGEALASIAAVARVRMASRPHASEQGMQVEVAASQLVSGPRPVGMPPGTVVDVRDLFYNTPARLKYLRTVQTEQARCLEVLQRAALARPDVAFRCETSGRVIWQTPGDGNPLSVMAALFGAGEAKQFLHATRRTADYAVEAWIGRPTQARSSRAHGHLFVNRRPIRNLAIHQAVASAFGQRLMTGRHPVYVLYLEMDPALVDVNVHPHKSEVRFSEERDLAALVQQVVRQALDDAFLVPSIRMAPRTETQAATAPLPLEQSEAQPSGPVATREFWPSPEPVPPNQRMCPETEGRSPGVVRERPVVRPEPRGEAIPVERWQAILAGGAAGEAYGPDPGRVHPEQAGNHIPVATPGETAPADEDPAKSRLAKLRPIGQALGTYILAEDGENLYIIDQHAAHERVLYERFRDRMRAARVGRLPLLAPIPVHLSPAEADRIRSQLAELQEAGLEVEDFGGSDVLVRTIPDIWDGLDAPRLAEEVVRSLAEDGAQADAREALRERIVLRACKAAIKAHDHLSDEEIAALCQALAGLEDPFHCPHGRPVILRLTQHELEKEFRRIV
ncbi:DNA mismatch repair endonuclease MutL [Alicyclobacillus macrosporangiidus]|uniref:DNA mismatch repair endonuclease MutL n=1 Tax=Alicyclobacillus macrosporangiidus TaxID=392015 RepID=UPI0026ED8661|nr:DNA mismatch repair endonuclease MutL [Alicyclobacillus macrosporangiidus]